MLKVYKSKLTFLVLIFFPLNSFASTLYDFESKVFKGPDYKLFFSINPSEHGTKNTMIVTFKCSNSKEKALKEINKHEICNLDYKNVVMKKTLKGYILEYSPYMNANWHKFYKRMNKGKEGSPSCDKSTKEKFVIKLEACK